MKRTPLMLVALALLLGGMGRAKADYIASVTLDTPFPVFAVLR